MSKSPDKRVLPVMKAVFGLLCQEVNSTFSNRASALLRSPESHRKLLELEVDALQYPNAHAFAGDYAVQSFLSKWKGLQTGVDTARVALDSWLAAEMKCRKTNEKIRDFSLRNRFGESLVDNLSVGSFISKAQRKIESVLGPSPRLASTQRGCKWSGGATFDIRRGAPLSKKIAGRISCTRSALPHLRNEIEHDPAWAEALIGFRPCGPFSLLISNFSIVEGNRFLTVPKNAKTDRCIAAEPTGNSFLQQGVGRFIRKRLKRFGVDLDDQSWNQLLAKLAISLELATLDLSAASDTICTEIIFLLFPIEWALYLNDLRSAKSRVDGKWVTLDKFSSMGNAFTFEVESLIFWALAEACLEPEGECITGIYGDDIVVPKSVAERVIALLEWCGFTLNRGKSHTVGPFYESCGKHYFHGFEVTPVYQKKFIDSPEGENGDFVSEIVRLHNRLVRWAIRYVGLEDSIPFRKRLRRRIVHEFNLMNITPPEVPIDNESDDGLLSMRNKFTWCPNRGFYCRVYVYKAKLKNAWNSPYYAYKLRNPRYTSPDPKGRVMHSLGGDWVWRNRYIHSTYEASALTS